jgi:hypothetical protein
LSYEGKLRTTVAYFVQRSGILDYMHPEAEHAEMKQVLKRNTELLEENNRLLRKMHRNAIWGFWLRVIFYGLFLGLPFLFYFYFVAPYVASLEESYGGALEQLESLSNIEMLQRFLETQP